MKIIFDDGTTLTLPDNAAVHQEQPFREWFRIVVEGSTDTWVNSAFVRAVIPDQLELEY